jgi:hypothetical protein
MAGDVLKARQIKWIIMSMMTIMAHQRSTAALGVIILAPSKTVINE